MKRKEFIKTSAIIGASLAVPGILQSASGLLAGESTRKVAEILNMQREMVGTLPILRAFAGDRQDLVSPYVLFDEFGPVTMSAGAKPLRVGAHPHAGVIPTTFFLSGNGHHKDSLDYDFQIGKGDFMMFSSGRGAIHMEETGKMLHDEGGIYHGFQIWLNMPSAYKLDAPATLLFAEKDFGKIDTEKVKGTVVLGEFGDAKSKIETLSPAFYYHMHLEADTRLDIPTDPTHNFILYLVNGDLELEGQQALKTNQVALYQRGESTVQLYAKEKAEILVLGGQPLNEVVYSYGPFVMNTEEQIRQCILDYQTGKMGDPRKVDR
jgi:redox-sensitive bicupin YhaK (pirin superfamily)